MVSRYVQLSAQIGKIVVVDQHVLMQVFKVKQRYSIPAESVVLRSKIARILPDQVIKRCLVHQQKIPAFVQKFSKPTINKPLKGFGNIMAL